MWVVVVVFVVFVAAIVSRFVYVWPRLNSGVPLAKRSSPVKTMIVLGSGGHTAELSPIIELLDPRLYSPRIYVSTEERSEQKISLLESRRPIQSSSSSSSSSFFFVRLPRARHVGQSFFSSIFSSIWALLHSIVAVLHHQPLLIVSDGPAVCVPLAAATLLLRFWRGRDACRFFFVESGCRVHSVSLSGKVLYHLSLADMFAVQWPQMLQLLPKAFCLGRTL